MRQPRTFRIREWKMLIAYQKHLQIDVKHFKPAARKGFSVYLRVIRVIERIINQAWNTEFISTKQVPFRCYKHADANDSGNVLFTARVRPPPPSTHYDVINHTRCLPFYLLEQPAIKMACRFPIRVKWAYTFRLATGLKVNTSRMWRFTLNTCCSDAATNEGLLHCSYEWALKG